MRRGTAKERGTLGRRHSLHHEKNFWRRRRARWLGWRFEWFTEIQLSIWGRKLRRLGTERFHHECGSRCGLGGTECSLAGWGKAKEEDVTRADHCSSSDFTLIDCLPLAVSCNFRRQQTDFWQRTHARYKLQGPRSPNLARTSVSFCYESRKKPSKPALLPRLRLLLLSSTCSVCESSVT